MASAGERRRNNVKAGIFVLITLALAVAVIIALSGSLQALRTPRDKYTASFEVASGIQSLTAGSPVRVGGLIMGRVTRIDPDVSGPSEMKRINVEFKIDRRVHIYKDVVIRIHSSLIGGEAWLEITDLGDGKEQLSPGDIIQVTGATGGGLLNMLLGDKGVDDAEATLAGAREFTESLNTKLDEYDANIAPTLENAREFMTDLNQNRWPSWADTIDEVMTWAEEKTADIDVILADGKTMMRETREMVEETRPRVSTTMDNVEEGTAQFRELATRANEETMDKVDRFLERGNEAMDKAVATIERLQQDYEKWAVDLGATLGNATLASQQIKLAMAEIRRSPWKVLYRPGADELDHELLYEAARSFAMAAADLKAASDSVDRVLDRYSGQLDEQAMGRIQSNLIDSMGNYEHAQQQLFDVLLMEEMP